MLLLGSLPGAASLAAGRYYAHPRNQFWRLLGGLLRIDLAALAYPARLDALAGAGVALWDAAHSAERAGSLDQALKAVRLNDLAGFAAKLPALRAVGFNGGAAWRLGAGAFAQRPDLALVKLPSSSPAHAMAFARKADGWASLAPFLQVTGTGGAGEPLANRTKPGGT